MLFNKKKASKNPSDTPIDDEKLLQATRRGLLRFADGDIRQYNSDVFIAANIVDRDVLIVAFENLKHTYLSNALDVDSQKSSLMRLLLAYLRAAHWVHWTTHWQVIGSSFYSDHKLMKKIYESLTDEIDTLAEKIVGQFNGGAVDPLEQTYFLLGFVAAICQNASTPIERAFIIEQSLQGILKLVYDQIKSLGNLSLGLDDFLMATANAHETNLYLLKQRLTTNDPSVNTKGNATVKKMKGK